VTDPPDPIRHLVVLGHPAPRSFNRTVAETYCETVCACGHQAELRDLYAIGFDPLLKADERRATPSFEPAPDVAAELELLRASEVVALVYPIWFGMPPAIIKGYVDRVLGAGFAARNVRHGASHPILQGKHLMILSSSASTRAWLEEQGQWVSLRQAFDTYLTMIFALESHHHLHFDSIVEDCQPHYLEECLESVRGDVRSFCARLFDERRRARRTGTEAVR